MPAENAAAGGLTDAKASAILAMRQRARSIVTVDFAQEVCDAFDLNVRDLRVVYEAASGIDLGVGVDRWRSGEMVNICSLACRIADALDAPQVKYDTDYIGAGKHAEAVTFKATLRIEALYGVDHEACTGCGELDVYEEGMCFSCLRARDDLMSVARVDAITWSDDPEFVAPEKRGATEFEALKGRDWGDRHPTLDEAMEEAYAMNAAAGLVGPVDLTESARRAI